MQEMEPDDMFQKTLALKYMKILRSFLLPIGAWSGSEFGGTTPKFVTFQRRTLGFQILPLFFGSALYVKYNLNDINFMVIIHVIIGCCMGVFTMGRIIFINIKGYSSTIREFIKFHLVHHKHKGGHYAEVNEMTDRASYIFALLQVFLMVSGPILFNIIPIYKDYQLGIFNDPRPANQTFDYAVLFAFPGFRQDDHFFISVMVNTYMSFMCTFVVCAIDMLLIFMVFQIIGHINTVMLDLENMKRPELVIDVTSDFGIAATNAGRGRALVERYNKEENEAVCLQLKEIINHHREIISFADSISSFYGPMLAWNYLIHSLMGCILLWVCTQNDPQALARFGALAFGIFGQLVELSVIFEVVGYKSERLIDSVYCSPWECMDVRNQRTVCYMLHKIQTPIQLTAMGIIPIGVETMLKIIKTSITYLAVLRSMSE